MLNRKESKPAHGTGNHTNGHERRQGIKPRPVRRRFIISAKAAAHPPSHSAAEPHRGRPGKSENGAKTAVAPTAPAVPGQALDLTETIKTLLHLAQEHGHVTYDDINDILPEGLSPEDLDELY